MADKYHVTGDEFHKSIHKVPLLADTFMKKGFSTSRFMEEDEVAELQNVLKGTYEEQLHILFTWKGEIDLAAQVQYHPHDDPEGFPNPRITALDLTPKTPEQNETYNRLLQELLPKANQQQHWYNTFEQHKKRIAAQISPDPTNGEEVLQQELQQIDAYFPKSEEGALLPNLAFPFNDNPDNAVSTHDDERFRGKLLTYLRGNKEINFNQFINWWNHLQILNDKEVLKYYNYLKAHIGKTESIVAQIEVTENYKSVEVSQPEDVKAIVEQHIACFKGTKKGYGKVMSDKEYDRLLTYTIHLVKKNRLPSNIKPFLRLPLSNEFIRQTYYRLHKEFNSRKIKNVWIEFIHEVFTQFNEVTQQTTKTKFSQYNKHGDYNADKKSITDY